MRQQVPLYCCGEGVISMGRVRLGACFLEVREGLKDGDRVEHQALREDKGEDHPENGCYRGLERIWQL